MRVCVLYSGLLSDVQRNEEHAMGITTTVEIGLLSLRSPLLIEMTQHTPYPLKLASLPLIGSMPVVTLSTVDFALDLTTFFWFIYFTMVARLTSCPVA